MNSDISASLFQKAKKLIPGGVDSPVRACMSVGCDPLFINRADGAYIYDVDGNRFMDFVGSWGPMILGHNHAAVKGGIQKALENGSSFGAPCPLEVDLAELVTGCFPSIDLVRFVSSGTEATMSAVRLARGYTGKKMIIKFDGCYHGHADSFLVKAGSGVITLGIPGSPGVPDDIVKNTLSIPYNDLQTLEKTLTDPALDIACVIVEPVAGNMGVVPPAEGFLQRLRELTQAENIVLIFDEVITGFRLGLGGAQEYFGVRPDLTCLGKIIGGGLPVGAYGGNKEIMDMVAPTGPVYQAGTLSGNPLAMAAGIATITALKQPGFYDHLEETAAAFALELSNRADKAGVATTLNRVGSMMTGFFCDTPVTDFSTAMGADTERYGVFFRAMREQGISIAPSQFEALFISSAHSQQDLEYTLDAAERSFRKNV